MRFEQQENRLVKAIDAFVNATPRTRENRKRAMMRELVDWRAWFGGTGTTPIEIRAAFKAADLLPPEKEESAK